MAMRRLSVRALGPIIGENKESLMSAAGLQFATTGVVTGDPVNAVALSAKMGISLGILSQAAHVEQQRFEANPMSKEWQAGLRTVADLWDDLTATFGGEENAKAFLARRRPELMDETPVHYLELGEPGVVQALVHSIKEMLP